MGANDSLFIRDNRLRKQHPCCARTLSVSATEVLPGLYDVGCSMNTGSADIEAWQDPRAAFTLRPRARGSMATRN